MKAFLKRSFSKKQIQKTIVIALLLCACFASYKFYKKKMDQPYLTVVGYVTMADGLGRQSVELISTLKDKMNINFIRTAKTNFKDVPDDVKKIISKKGKKKGKVIIFEDCVWRPKEQHYKILERANKTDRIHIAYSMIEGTKIPSEWVYILNQYFDAVAVPDKFLVDVYTQSGVEIPVFELPLGLELDNFLSQPLKTKSAKPMVFANLGSGIERKNHLLLIRAFAEAFGNSSDVLLRINFRYADKELIKVLYQEIAHLRLDNVEISQLCLDKSEYLEFFQNIDCYVSLSKAEGFSIQPREAMALGIPTIVTNNTAQTTICESNLVKTVTAALKESTFYPWGEYCGYKFNCKIEDAVQAFKDVYTNYDAYLAKGAASRKWASRYAYKELKPYYLALVKPETIVLGKENKIEPNCLITNSKSLYDKYKKNIDEKR